MDRTSTWNLAALHTYTTNPTLNFWSFEGAFGGSGQDTFIIIGAQDISLLGGAGDDLFIFYDGASITGSVGGDGGTDLLDFSRYTTPWFVNLVTGVMTGAAGGNGGIEGLWTPGPVAAPSPITAPPPSPAPSLELAVTILPVRLIRVVSGEITNISCMGCAAVILRLPEGHQVNFGCGNGDQASLTAMLWKNLPGKLAVGDSLIAGMKVQVFVNGLPIDRTATSMIVSFLIPRWLRGNDFLILYWNENSNSGQGGWVAVPTMLTEDGRAIAYVKATGDYALVVRGERWPLACASGNTPIVLRLPDGNRVQIPCGTGEKASLAPAVLWNLPQALPDARSFIYGMTVDVYSGAANLAALPDQKSLGVSFVVPQAFKGSELVILHWDGSGWREMPTTITADGRAETENTGTGLYVLAQKVEQLACGNTVIERQVGNTQVNVTCPAGSTAAVNIELEETLPDQLRFEDTFVAGVTLSGPVTGSLTFDVPASPTGELYSLLRFDPALYDGAGGWVVVADGVSAALEMPGTYILVLHPPEE